MKQGLPVFRQLYWLGLLPQLAAIAAIGLVIYPLISSRSVGIPETALVAATSYWVFCFLMRRIFAREHKRGMKAYRASRFEDALEHYTKSYESFSKHPWLDRYRFILLGTASPNPYTTVSLCNMAFCETQLGHGERAIELYEQALKLTPGCTPAEVALRMLRSTQKP